MAALSHTRRGPRTPSDPDARVDGPPEHAHSARADERRRVARELHDDVAARLAAALNAFELHDIHRDTDPELALAKLETARRTVRESLDALRDVMAGLRTPPRTEPLRTEPLRTESLRTALLEDLEHMGAHTADVRVEVTGDPSALPPGTAEEVLLILREAQRNAVRHARARRVAVTARLTPGEVRAAVEDDGVGFDPRAAVPRGHGGLHSMRERAELLGAGLTVESRPGHGSRVLLSVPLTGKHRADHP